MISRLEQALDGAYSANNPLNVAERITDTEWATRIAAFALGQRTGCFPARQMLGTAVCTTPPYSSARSLRMLRDPKSLSLVTNFLEPWLSLDQIKGIPMDPELLQSMETETRLFLESQLREDRGVLELWTATLYLPQ